MKNIIVFVCLVITSCLLISCSKVEISPKVLHSKVSIVLGCIKYGLLSEKTLEYFAKTQINPSIRNDKVYISKEANDMLDQAIKECGINTTNIESNLQIGI